MRQECDYRSCDSGVSANPKAMREKRISDIFQVKCRLLGQRDSHSGARFRIDEIRLPILPIRPIFWVRRLFSYASRMRQARAYRRREPSSRRSWEKDIWPDTKHSFRISIWR